MFTPTVLTPWLQCFHLLAISDQALTLFQYLMSKVSYSKGFHEVGWLAHLAALSTKNTEEHPHPLGFHLQTASKLQLQNLQLTLVSYTLLALGSGLGSQRGAPSGYGF